MENTPQTLPTPHVLEKLIVGGDLSALSSEEKILYYQKVCQAVGLNPATQPLSFIKVKNGKGGTKEILYALRNATDQLCKVYKISTEIVARETNGDSYCVVCRATKVDGQATDAMGVVSLNKKKWSGRELAGYEPLMGDDRANALMKAETKAKRRAVLSLVGLSLLDETEVETIRGASFPKESLALPASQDDIDDAKICDKGASGSGESATQTEAKPSQGMKAKTESPASDKDKPFWINEWRGKTYIHARHGKTFSEDFLKNLGMKLNKKGTAYSKIFDEATQDALSAKFINNHYEKPTQEQVDHLRAGFISMGLEAEEITRIINDLTGKAPDPASWTTEDFDKLRQFQGDNYPG